MDIYKVDLDRMWNYKNLNLSNIYQFLLIILAFLMPLTVFGANVIVVFIVLLWLFSGGYRNKIKQIFDSKLLLASIAFFCLHLIGLFWTENIVWGLHIVHKMWYFGLFFPVLYNIVQKDYVKLYISSFLLAIVLTQIISFLVWFEIVGPFMNATKQNPTPFMSHIHYNPILAFATYLVLHQILFNKDLSKVQLYFYYLLVPVMSINMFITGGRAGQVMFFSMIAIIIFQYFSMQKLKAFFLMIIITSSIFFCAYQFSSIFNERVNDVFTNIQIFETNKFTSVGLRVSMILNSWEIIGENFFLGVGTGDFPDEYKIINEIHSPELPDATNPHNMFILIWVQLGLIGLLGFLMIFYYQLKISLQSNDNFYKHVGIALPLLYLIIMFSDSYLLGHYTSLMFFFFSSFLYKDFKAK